eukprot:Platyproteum_vivax@DN6351_c0_g1_i1.p1
MTQKQFINRDNLKKHLRENHELTNKELHDALIENKSGINAMVCSECGDTYTQYKSYWRHMNEKHSSNPKPKKVCPICKKDFIRNFSFQRHMKSNHSTKEFKCPHCSYSTMFEGDYKSHVENAHEEQDEGPKDSNIDTSG